MQGFVEKTRGPLGVPVIHKSSIKMAQHLNLRRVLVPAPKVLKGAGAKTCLESGF